MKKKFILASNNRHKQKEFSYYFNEQILIPEDLGIAFDVEESALTFMGNALLKAEELYKQVKRPVLADDSGLVIAAMPDLLGVRSARFEEGMSQEKKNEKIIKLMEKEQNREAYFVCALVLYWQEDSFMSVQTTWRGTIAHQILGTQGFGYDPIFVLEDGRHVAELNEQEKSSLSHRGRAMAMLEKWFTANE